MRAQSIVHDIDIFHNSIKNETSNKLPHLIESGKLDGKLPPHTIITYTGEDTALSEYVNINIKSVTCNNFEPTIPTRSPVIPFPEYTIPLDTSISLQKWKGVVKEINRHRKIFIASLTDLSNNNLPEGEAEFLIDELSDDDKELLKLGAVFYWNIHYFVTSGKQRERRSSIRFRRLPVWTKKNIEEAQLKASKLTEKFEHR